jgi:surfeit locus 1 family protein
VTGASAYGTGYWVLTPLKTDAGRTLYVNRGYVPMGTTRDAVIAATLRCRSRSPACCA